MINLIKSIRLRFSIFNFFREISSKYLMKKIVKSPLPSFDKLYDYHIKKNSYIDPYFTYRNKLYWAPKFYIFNDLSFEFLEGINKFKKVKEWDSIMEFALVQLILTEAIRDTTFKLMYDYECIPKRYNHFNGFIRILIYNSDPDNL